MCFKDYSSSSFPVWRTQDSIRIHFAKYILWDFYYFDFISMTFPVKDAMVDKEDILNFVSMQAVS